MASLHHRRAGFLHHNLSSSFVFYKATFLSFLLQFLFGLRVDEDMNLMFFSFCYFLTILII